MLAGNFSTSATVQLQPGQTLMGAGMLTVRTAGGHVATVATPGGATITGAVTMGNNSTLTGMTVSNVSTGGGLPNPFAVEVNGVSGATISGNTLSVLENLVGGSAQGILVRNSSSNIISAATASPPPAAA